MPEKIHITISQNKDSQISMHITKSNHTFKKFAFSYEVTIIKVNIIPLIPFSLKLFFLVPNTFMLMFSKNHIHLLELAKYITFLANTLLFRGLKIINSNVLLRIF